MFWANFNAEYEALLLLKVISFLTKTEEKLKIFLTLQNQEMQNDKISEPITVLAANVPLVLLLTFSMTGNCVFQYFQLCKFIFYSRLAESFKFE